MRDPSPRVEDYGAKVAYYCRLGADKLALLYELHLSCRTYSRRVLAESPTFALERNLSLRWTN